MVCVVRSITEAINVWPNPTPKKSLTPYVTRREALLCESLFLTLRVRRIQSDTSRILKTFDAAGPVTAAIPNNTSFIGKCIDRFQVER